MDEGCEMDEGCDCGVQFKAFLLLGVSASAGTPSILLYAGEVERTNAF